MDYQLAKEVVDRVNYAIGDAPVGLHDPTLVGNEFDYLNQCLESGQVSSIGSFVNDFESNLAAMCGVGSCVATVNGTAALHVAMVLAGVQPGDEVVMSPLSFVAPANAVAYCGAQPVFLDIESDSLGLSPEALESWLRTDCIMRANELVNRRTGSPVRAVIAVHVFGHPCRIDELVAVASEFGLPVIEDAAESLGSLWGNRATGSFGLIGVLSFNGNKIVTTGGGGALLGEDYELMERARHLTTTAKVDHPWQYFHDSVGYNYRMPNINAALGLAQLESLDGFISRKRELFARYSAAFSEVKDVSVLSEPTRARSNYWLQNLVLSSEAAGQRDAILEALIAAGYGARPAWEPLSQLPAFKQSSRDGLENVARLAKRIISVPSGAGIV